jgi:hypothetical protein
VILEQALKDIEDSSITGKAIIADVLTEGEVILLFNHERTLKASYKEFETRIGAIRQVGKDFVEQGNGRIHLTVRFSRSLR